MRGALRNDGGEETKETRVEGALERKRASLPISRKHEGAVDERNRGMSSRVRTCSRSRTLLHATGAISIRAKSVPSFLLFLPLQNC